MQKKNKKKNARNFLGWFCWTEEYISFKSTNKCHIAHIDTSFTLYSFVLVKSQHEKEHAYICDAAYYLQSLWRGKFSFVSMHI